MINMIRKPLSKKVQALIAGGGAATTGVGYGLYRRRQKKRNKAVYRRVAKVLFPKRGVAATVGARALRRKKSKTTTSRKRKARS